MALPPVLTAETFETARCVVFRLRDSDMHWNVFLAARERPLRNKSE